MKKVILILILFLFGHGFAGEKIKIFVPAHDVLLGIKKLAISEFENNESVASLLYQKLMQTHYFKVLQPEEIEKKLQKTNLTIDDLTNIEKPKEICTALEIDGLIFGEITVYQVEPDEKGIEQINKQIWTGKYVRDENDNIIEENIEGKLVKKKLFEEKIINQKYRIRKGTVSITFNIIDGKSGKLAISTTVTKDFNSGKILEEEIKSLPPADQILEKLLPKVITDFVEYISPKLVNVKRDVETGDGFIDEGKAYALYGLWPEAMETWLKAEKAFPNNSAVYYNLGLANEAIGEYDKAEEYYKKAALLKDKKLYKKALKNLRKAREKKEKKLIKGKK